VLLVAGILHAAPLAGAVFENDEVLGGLVAAGLSAGGTLGDEFAGARLRADEP
jgi:hypothetical protein